MIAANRASKPRAGSSTIKPANVAKMTTEDAIVSRIMFSNLLPLCVFYVHYDYGLEVYVVYPRFVIKLLFIDSSAE